MSYQRDYDRRLRVGVVGVGLHCYRNILPCLTFLPVELTSFCDLNEERLRRTASQYGVQRVYLSSAEMYAKERLDAVFLCVGPQMHPSLACEALGAGVNVWMEKPPAVRAEGVERMIAARGDRVVVVGFKKAFMPCIRKAKEILSMPESGALKTILVQYPVGIPANGREILESGQVCGWLANGCHPLSAMMEIGGRVGAVTVQRGARGGGICILEFENGALGNFHLAEGPGGVFDERFVFISEKCQVNVENSSRVSWLRGIELDYARTADFAPPGTGSGTVVWEPQNMLSTLENKSLFTQGIYGEMKYFCDCILEGRKAQQGSLEFALDLMKVCEAGLLSDGRRMVLG